MLLKTKNFRRNFCLFIFFVAVFGFMPTNLSSDRIIWAAATALLLLNTIIDVAGHKVKFNVCRCYLQYCIVVLFGLISIIWSAHTEYTIDYLTTSFPVISVGFFCVNSYMNSDDNIDQVMRIIVYAACIAAVRYCLYTSWSHYLRGNFGALLNPNTNYNAYTSPLCIAFIISAYYALTERKKDMFIAMMFIAAVLVVAGARKTILVIPIAIAVFALSQSKLKNTMRIIFIMMIVLAAGIYGIMTVPQLAGVKQSLVNAYKAFVLGEQTNIGKSTSERIYLMETAKEVWLKHPIIGVGWNNFRYLNTAGLYSHNNYLELLSCLGIVGFVLYYWMHIRALWLEFRIHKKKNRNRMSKFVIGVVVCVLFLDVGSVPVYSREVMMLFLIILGMGEYSGGYRIRKLSF